MIVKMSKIRIVGPKPLLPAVMKSLQDCGAVHIESNPSELARLTEALPLLRRRRREPSADQEAAAWSGLLERVKGLLLILSSSPAGRAAPLEGSPAPPPLDLGSSSTQKLAERITSIEGRIKTLVRKRKRYEDERGLLARYQRLLDALAPLLAALGPTRQRDMIGLTLQAKERDILPLLEEALSRLTGGRHELFTRPVDPELLAGLLIVPQDQIDRVKTLLIEKRIGEFRLPSSFAEKPLAEAIRIIQRKEKTLPEKIERIDLELTALSQRWEGPLKALRCQIEDRLAQMAAADALFETRMTFLMVGWIPRTSLPPLEAALEATFKGNVLLEEIPIDRTEEDRVPVLIRNRRGIGPFERFTRLLPLPRYGTIDPTPLIALFFPLFFGIIVGDVGYGLLLLAAAGMARRRLRADPLLADLSAILSWGALSTLVWGIAYGEFFGDLGNWLGFRPLLFHRMEDFLDLLFFAVAAGVGHLVLGIGLGCFIAARRGRRSEVLVRLLGLFVLAAFLVTAAGIIGWAPRRLIWIGGGGMLVAASLLVGVGGSSALMELHNLVNLLSYLRIMGIGVASAALAFAANRLADLAGNLFLGIVIAASLHAINLAFAVLSPTIQSLRLHFVEFFENFFEGGGEAYRPFRRTV